MIKIPTVWQRDPHQRRFVVPTVTEGCEWVLAGEGVATRKYEGTHVYLDEHGAWWARREIKPGQKVPGNFVLVERDDTTMKEFGRVPAKDSAFVKPLVEALQDPWTPWRDQTTGNILPGGYELCGPKINGNPERLEKHTLISHDRAEVSLDDRDHDLRGFDAMEEFVLALAAQNGWEGIVYKHPDGRQAKIKARDYPRPPQ